MSMVLFVDINDVCRAPLAARLYEQGHGGAAHSAGVYAFPGAALGDAVRPAELDGHTAQLLSGAMLDKAERVWCVTAAIACHLLAQYPQHAHKIRAMDDVPDPFGGGREAYLACAQQLRAQLEELP